LLIDQDPLSESCGGVRFQQAEAIRKYGFAALAFVAGAFAKNLVDYLFTRFVK
jgi:hypothetical protein